MTVELVKSFDQVCRETFGPDFGSSEALAEFQAQNMDLQKAMASAPVAGQNYGDLTALRLEDLDSTMTAVLFKSEHLKLQRWLARTPAKQLIWQYDIQNQYGNSRGQAGFPEGQGPSGGVSKYTRATAQIRFFGRMGGITQQSSMMRAGMLIDPVAAENSNRTLELLETIERQLIFGNSALVDQSNNTVTYDGLYYQIANNAPAENVIDMAGAPLDFNTFDTIGYTLAEQRFVTDFSRIKAFMGGTVKSDMATLLRQQDRRELGGKGSQPAGGYVPGSPIAGYESQFGYFPFEHSIFMEPVAGKKPVAAGEAVSPLTATTIASATPAGGSTTFAAGTYYWFVSALYVDGETMPSVGVSATPTATQQVAIVINRPGGGSVDASLRGYRLYRGTTSVATAARWIADVADPRTGTTTTFTDVNAVIPGTDVMLVLEGSPENLVIAQLAPLMRYPLPPVQTTLPFYLLLYHTLVVRAASRQFLVKNIGRLV